MPHLILPKSARGRQRGLNRLKTKNDSVPLLDQIITAPTKARLNTQQSVVTIKMDAVAVAKRNMNLGTKTVKTAWLDGKSLIADYFKGMFRIVKRVDKRISDVVFYHIAESRIVAPTISKLDDVTLWGGYIETGETNRVAAGGTVMANPSAADVAVGIGDFNTKTIAQSGLKDGFNTTRTNLATENEETDKVIKKAYAELGTFYDEGTQANKRLYLVEYGVTYGSEIKKTFNVTVLNNLTGDRIFVANVELIETGLERNTGAAGQDAVLVSVVMDSATFAASHEGFVDGDSATITVSETTLVYNVTIRLNPL
jgi:hypothetical protein